MPPTTPCRWRQQSRRPTAPKFLAIILEPRANTLKISDEFCRRYKRNLPDRVSLKVGGAAVSQVGLVRRNGETFFSEGWEEFKRRYSLDFGSLLLFKYDGASRFDVCIFGLNASEICYPFDLVPNAEEPAGKTRESLSTTQGVKRTKLRRGCKLRPNLGSAPGCSKVKLELSSSEESGETRANFSTSRGVNRTKLHRECKLKKVKLEPSSSEEQEKSTAGEAPTPHEKAVSFTRANKSSLNPFSITKMMPSYINGCAMHVSATFAREFLPLTPSHLTLRLMNGKEWPVKYSMGKSFANIYGGWRDFVRDNGLKVGDACVFEVAGRTELVWNVIIFRK